MVIKENVKYIKKITLNVPSRYKSAEFWSWNKPLLEKKTVMMAVFDLSTYPLYLHIKQRYNTLNQKVNSNWCQKKLIEFFQYVCQQGTRYLTQRRPCEPFNTS
jgi:hypothetical protein